MVANTLKNVSNPTHSSGTEEGQLYHPLFAISPDSTRIAYDRCGSGPALVLLHGGGGSRQEWHQVGYVHRLRDHFTVISLDLRQAAIDCCAHWQPIIQALQQDKLDAASLAPGDQETLRSLNVPAMMGWVQAMLDWPEVAPSDFRCPTLFLVGSEDMHAIESLKSYETSIPESLLQFQVIKGVDHDELFEAVDKILPILLKFSHNNCTFQE